jgi:hypothetical protein
MEFFRKSTIGAACIILFVSSISFGFTLATWRVIGQPGPIENALSQSNAYNAIVTNFVQSHQDDTTIGVPLTIPAVQAAVQKAFPESVVEPAVNQFISATYAWAQGKTPNLTFSINLSSAKTNLANYVGQAVEQQAATMPTCTQSQIINSEQAEQNPLTITCIPPGVNITTVSNDAKQTVLNSSFLKDPVLTPASLNLVSANKLKLSSQQAATPKLISPPTIYHRLIESLYITLGLMLVCIAVIIWLHRSHLRGLRRVGGALGWAGLLCIFDAMITSEAATWLKHSKLVRSSGLAGTFYQTITKIVTYLANDYHLWLLRYGIVLLIVGLGTWVGVRIWETKHKKPETHDNSTPIMTGDLTSVS